MRPEWHDYFMQIAIAVSARADCRRAQFGAVIVKDHRIISTGYNGAPAGYPGCLTGNCPRGLLSYDEIPHGSSYDTGKGACISLHAEQNAIIYGDYDKMKGSELYVNGEPCDGCMKMIRGAGISWLHTPKQDAWVSSELRPGY